MSRQCFLDFGNSRVKAWLCVDNVVLGKISHEHRLDVLSFFTELPDLFQQKMDFVGVTSVLDAKSNHEFAVQAEHQWGVRPSFAESQESCCGVRNGYRQPAQLGVDRWMNILAVSGQEGGCCVVSCGTAMTIDMIEGSTHTGGFILPGLQLQLQSLIQGTQKVRPDVVSDSAVSPGCSTTEAVHRGILLGQVSMIDRCFNDMRQRLGGGGRLVLTGGYADKLGPHLACPHDIIPELVLVGLMRYFDSVVSTEEKR